jgi:hypothetical protein
MRRCRCEQPRTGTEAHLTFSGSAPHVRAHTNPDNAEISPPRAEAHLWVHLSRRKHRRPHASAHVTMHRTAAVSAVTIEKMFFFKKQNAVFFRGKGQK